jgi:phytoene/squalene synthetase
LNKNTLNISTAYHNALVFTKSHYENFPVVSLFVEKALRKHVAIFYQFARQADDIADEGEKSSEKRLIELLKYENHLKRALLDDFENEFWAALKNTIDNFHLDHNNFLNLIRAFEQDIIKNSYETFDRNTKLL